MSDVLVANDLIVQDNNNATTPAPVYNSNSNILSTHFVEKQHQTVI